MNQRRRYQAKRRRRLRRLYRNLSAAMAAWNRGSREVLGVDWGQAPAVTVVRMPDGAVRGLFNPSAESVAAYYRALTARIR